MAFHLAAADDNIIKYNNRDGPSEIGSSNAFCIISPKDMSNVFHKNVMVFTNCVQCSIKTTRD